MKEIKLYLSVHLDMQAYDFFRKWWVAISTDLLLMELHVMPFQHEYDCKHVKLSATKLRDNEKDNKNSRF